MRNILSFRKDYPDATVVTLEQNYRSTQPILDAAYHVIRVNEDRAEKRLWTERAMGEKVALLSVYNELEEALAVAAEIDRLVRREALSLNDFAVLYRTNAQSRAFEDVLLRRGIAYQLVGGLRFYERREIKDVLAYLRLIANPRDTVSFARIVNVPRRKIGERTVAEIERLARSEEVSPLDAIGRLEGLDDVPSLITSAATQALVRFRRLIQELRELSFRASLPALLERVLEASGYRAMLSDGTPEGRERWENVLELAGLADEYRDIPAPDGLFQFLEQVALVSDVDTFDESSQAVTLITLHQVKGLEFPIVFMAGMEEGLLPHIRALEEGDAGIAEERRLTYVGMTRAKQRLYLLHAYRRHLYGSSKVSEASRFLDHIPRELLQRPASASAAGVGDPRSPGAARRAVHAHAVRANPVDIAPQRFNTGMRVGHARYGTGTILKSTMTRNGEEVVIRFDTHGVKMFSVADSVLTPL